MKTRPCPHPHSRSLALLAGSIVLLAGADASARDYIRIPLPPPPREILHDVGDLLHRIGDRVGSVVRRIPWVDDDDERERARAPRRSKAPPPVKRETWDDARRQVPYRYDDADEFDARMQPSPIERRPAEIPDSALLERRPAVPRDSSPAGRGAPEPRRGEDVPPVNIVGPKTAAADAPATRTQESPPPVPPAEIKKTEPPPPVPKAAEPGNLLPGTPVAGKRGLVYPPGAKHTPENMVDVTDFKPGQVVRDPRTGSLFRVP